jgi:hypothetical protein
MAAIPESSAAATRAARRTELCLFALLWVSYAYFFQSGGQNEAARLDLARAMIEQGVLYVDDYRWNTADIIVHVRDGVEHFYSNKAPGVSLVIVLPFALVSAALRLLGLPEWLHWNVAIYTTTLLTISLISALAGVVMFRVARRISGSTGGALLGVVAVWLGSIVFPFSTLLFGHQLAGAFLTFAFALVFALRSRGEAAFRRPALAVAAAGFLAGLAVVTEYPAFLLAALVGGYLLIALACAGIAWRRSAELAGAFAAGAGAACAILFVYNWIAFGSLLYIPYQSYAEGVGPHTFAGHALGFLGMHWPGAAEFGFVLAQITVRAPRGLVYLGFGEGRIYALSPVLWLALPGLFWLRRAARPEALFVLTALAAFLIFNACYGDSIHYWGGAASVGPRHIVPMLPFLALPLAFAVRRLPWAFVPLLAVSVFYVLLATAIEPRVGSEFDNPSRELFLANYLEGRFALGRDSIFDQEDRLLTEDSVAFNLGKLIGLDGAWQLAPLLLAWILLGVRLARAAGLADGVSAGAPGARLRERLASPELVGAGLGLYAAFVLVWPLLP